ncbi:MAG: hypothetical protein QM723_04390 [Myxococcaceae bacterium]
MRRALLLVPWILGPRCQCLVPVDQCAPSVCTDAGFDAGTHDAGSSDAGHPPDSGTVDAGHDAGVADSGAPWDGGACALWDGSGTGDCAATTGYVFDGMVCRGDCVLYPITSPGVFPTVADCVHACAIPYCNTALLKAVLAQPFTPNAYCDDLQVETGLPWLVSDAFPELDAGCAAPTGPTHCTLLQSLTLDDAGYLDACAATLLPETTSVTCWLYGP